MATYDFNDGLVPSDIVLTRNATFIIRESALSVGSNVETGGDALALFNSAADGTFSVDCAYIEFQGAGEPYGNIGIAFRASDLNNSFELIVRHADNKVRLIKVEAGVRTPLIEQTVSGYVQEDVRNLKVVTDGTLVEIFLDDVKIGQVNDAFNQNATLAGVRIDSEEYRADNIVLPDASTATKTVTFDIPTSAKDVSDMKYWVTPINGGAALLNGTLDTSGATVAFDLGGISTVSAGEELLLFATNEGSASGSGIVAWDNSTVVDSGV